MVEAEPQRGRGRELGIAAADPALREKAERDDKHQCARPPGACRSSAELMPVTMVSTKKPPASASDIRFEIVIVKRSLEAANAINAGNKRSLIASVSIIGTSSQMRCSVARDLFTSG